MQLSRQSNDDQRHEAGAIDYLLSIPVEDQETVHRKTLEKQKTRENFIEELRKTMLEDQVRNGANSHGLLNHEHGGDYYLTQEGKLTEVFKMELAELSKEEIKRLESKIIDLKPPQEDCFGIKRRICQVCEKDCSGYQSANFMFASSTQQRGEFPTFCKLCACPAHFHKVVDGQFNFPENLGELVKSNNIQSDDINWNCVMSTFMLETGSKNKIAEVIQLLKDEGIEVISYTQRYIQAEEAFLLRSRIVDMQLEDQQKAFQQTFKKTGKDNQIKQSLALDTFSASDRGQQNPYLLEKISQQKEQFMKSQLTQTNKTGTRTQYQTNEQKQESKNENQNQSNKVATHNTLKPGPLPTVAEEDDEDLERAFSEARVSTAAHRVDTRNIRAQQVFDEMTKQKRLMPQSVLREPKLKEKSRNEPQAKTSDIHHDVDEKEQIEFLVQCLEQNQLLQQLCQNEIVFLILSSSQVQNLSGTVKQALTKFDNSKGTRMVYFSQDKIQSLEDCVQFVPHLFRLSKSIMVSEPLEPFLAGVNQASFGRQTYLSRLVDTQDNGDHLEGRDLNPYREKTVQTHYSDRQAVSLQSKLSFINRTTKTTRKENQSRKPSEAASRRGSVDSLDRLSQESWVQRAQAKDAKGNKKEATLSLRNNKILFNYGIMRDFFNYSGMSVQSSHKSSDFSKPLRPCGIRGGLASATQSYGGADGPQPCNMFAIAKVGLPNLIMPNTLDLKFSNFENFDSYSKVSDMFFPDLSVNHQSVIILRPLMVRNKLNDLMVNILRANEFLILKRKIRPLTGGEVGYLFSEEGIPESNKEFYFDLMQSGPCEIIVVSKLSGVHDAKTLMNGSSPFGRRRLNQINEDSKNARSNVDSVSAMFEVAPFTSFTELLDLEDFLGRNGRLAKFTKQNKNSKQPDYLVAKAQENKQQIAVFARFFNFTGYSSHSIKKAQNDICVFAPSVATLTEVIFILNPIYNPILEDAFELLIRQGYQILKHHTTHFTDEQVVNIYAGKIDFETQDGVSFLRQMTNDRCHVFHLIKLAGDRETRQLYLESDLQLEDLLLPTNFGQPLKPVYIPYIFLFLDSFESFEFGLSLLYKPEHLKFTGRQIFHYKSDDVLQILQMCLLVTLGDTVKILERDTLGNMKSMKKDRSDSFEPLVQTYQSRDGRIEPQFVMSTLDDKNGKAKHCAFAVESQSQGVFEVRFLTINKAVDTMDTFLQQFATLSLFYKEASKVSSNTVPAFYKYKIAGNCNRVYEVEENMGDHFMVGLSKLHINHLKIVEMNSKLSLGNKQKSIPAFVFGAKLSQMCRNLQQIKTKNIGAGKFVYSPDEEEFVGEVKKVTDSSYFFYDKQRYLGCLENFKKGWLYYISILEADIIEMKLQIILNSLTFRYSRQPEFLKLVPERLTAENLRVSEKIKIINMEGMADNAEKFFKADRLGVIDPNREIEVSSRVESIMQTLKQAQADFIKDIDKKLQSKGKSNFQGENTQKTEKILKDYSIHNDVGISGFQDGVARRPAQHLVASLIWILEFEYRKIERCPQVFVGDRDYKYAKTYIDKEYDEIIDIVEKSFLEDYYKDHEEALDVMKLRKNEVGDKSDFQSQIEFKQKLEASMLKQLQDKVETERRKARTTATIQQLIQTEIFDAADEAKKQQRLELKQFLSKKGNTDRDGAEFQQFLEKSKMQFGPYAVSLAESFLQNQQLKQAMAKDPKMQPQELISFIKMEYFLYGCAEANHIISQLRHMEDKINEMNEKYDVRSIEINELAGKLRGLTYEPRHIPERKLLTSKHNLMVSDRLTLEESIFQFRLEISTKETVLVSVFKELMSCDFYVADDHFSKETSILNNFKIPLETFWRPVMMPEYIEYNLNNQQFEKQVGAMPHLTEMNYGQFLSQHVRDIVMGQEKTKDKITQLKQGAKASNLNKPDISDKPKDVTFDKFGSAAEAKMQEDLEAQEKLLKEKGSKAPYKPNVIIEQ